MPNPITYTVTEDGPYKGKTFTGGHPDEINGTPVVRFKEKIKGKTVGLRYDTRPDLAALVKVYQFEQAEEEKKRKQEWAEAEARRAAEDQIEIDKMEAEAARLRKLIPPGMVELRVVNAGEFDGYRSYQYFTPDNSEVSKRDGVEIVGVASAIRPGAMNSFKDIVVAYIDPVKLADVKAEQMKRDAEKRAEEEMKKEAREKKLAYQEVLKSRFEMRVVSREDRNSVTVQVTEKSTGESKKFYCRNIFDFGYTINPAYAVMPGLEPGGMAIKGKWQTYDGNRGWYDVRPLTDFEEGALAYLYEFPPVSDRIRM